MNKILGIVVVTIMLTGCSLLGSQNSNVDPADSMVSDESSMMEAGESGEDKGMDGGAMADDQGGGSRVGEKGMLWFQLQAAMSKKHPDWVIEDYEIEITKDMGDYVEGTVKQTDAVAGGGYFYAARDESGEWVIAADGNGAIMCEEIEPYDFPTEMIGKCYDDASGTEVTR